MNDDHEQLRPPDPGGGLLSQIWLSAASETIASTKSILNTSQRILRTDCNTDSQARFQERIRNLETVIHQRIGTVPLCNLSPLQPLLGRYHHFLLKMEKFINARGTPFDVQEEHISRCDDFQEEFKDQFSSLTPHWRGGAAMFSNSSNIVIYGGTFVTAETVTCTKNQHADSDEPVIKLKYKHIIFGAAILFGTAGHTA
uniref:Uncharacterized protein n=1 Tax=Psilocybe cubensis TaxID=181762 RepID=A0A8H7XPX3_PSICU